MWMCCFASVSGWDGKGSNECVSVWFGRDAVLEGRLLVCMGACAYDEREFGGRQVFVFR